MCELIGRDLQKRDLEIYLHGIFKARCKNGQIRVNKTGSVVRLRKRIRDLWHAFVVGSFVWGTISEYSGGVA